MLLVILVGFVVFYLMCLLGVLCFGYLGDCLGWCWMLLVLMVLMVVVMLVIVLLLIVVMVGMMVGVLLLILCCVMVFLVGGEYIGVVVYLLESVLVW